jgi:hypothetical protein
MPKHKNWFWLTAFAAACFFDFLFWKKNLGISFVIWVAVLIIIGYLLAWREGRKPAFASILITLLILGFAFVPAWRSEPFTRFFSAMLTMGGLLLLSATFLTGNWPFYKMVDYFKTLFSAIGGGLSRAIMLGTKNATPPPLDEPQKPAGGKKIWAILRGLLIALPIVAVLALLLTAADPVFGDWLKKILDLEKLPEYLFRAFYIVVIGGILVGIFLHAILPSKTEERPDPNKAWMKPFLGWTETAVILAAVDLLFLAFIFIQMRYLFGGTVNINETGFTYADYARRGFGELVAVAVLSLGLYLVLHTVTKRESKGSQVGFSALTILLMTNVLVILASSMQRLVLYEEAYGFSQLRTYTHVFIYCLAALIVVTVFLELFRRRGHFALALLVMTLAFGATLVLMNVNGFIADKNVSRAVTGEELDVPYLVSLSSDAVPTMLEKFKGAATPKSVKEDLGYALACRTALMDDPATLPWQGFNISTSQAWNLLQTNKSAIAKYKLQGGDDYGWYYVKDGDDIYCDNFGFMD